MGDLPAARVAFQRAFQIFSEFLPEEHPKIKMVQENLESIAE